MLFSLQFYFQLLNAFELHDVQNSRENLI